MKNFQKLLLVIQKQAERMPTPWSCWDLTIATTSFRREKPAMFGVWVGVTSSEVKTPLTFVEDGVKINKHICLYMLRKTNFRGWMSWYWIMVWHYNKTARPLKRSKWLKPGARGNSLLSDWRKCGLLIHLTLNSWTLQYAPYLRRKLAKCLNQVWKLWRKNKQIYGTKLNAKLCVQPVFNLFNVSVV